MMLKGGCQIVASSVALCWVLVIAVDDESAFNRQLSQTSPSPSISPSVFCFDAAGYCAAGTSHCKTSFCPTCAQAHFCDWTCGFCRTMAPTVTTQPTSTPLPTLVPSINPSPPPSPVPTPRPTPQPTPAPSSAPPPPLPGALEQSVVYLTHVTRGQGGAGGNKGSGGGGGGGGGLAGGLLAPEDEALLREYGVRPSCADADDTPMTRVALPWPFSFGGVRRRAMYVNANGGLFFGPRPPCKSNFGGGRACNLFGTDQSPELGYKNLVAAFVTDLDPSQASAAAAGNSSSSRSGGGGIRYVVSGGKALVRWSLVPLFGSEWQGYSFSAELRSSGHVRLLFESVKRPIEVEDSPFWTRLEGLMVGLRMGATELNRTAVTATQHAAKKSWLSSGSHQGTAEVDGVYAEQSDVFLGNGTRIEFCPLPTKLCLSPTVAPITTTTTAATPTDSSSSSSSSNSSTAVAAAVTLSCGRGAWGCSADVFAFRCVFTKAVDGNATGGSPVTASTTGGGGSASGGGGGGGGGNGGNSSVHYSSVAEILPSTDGGGGHSGNDVDDGGGSSGGGDGLRCALPVDSLTEPGEYVVSLEYAYRWTANNASQRSGGSDDELTWLSLWEALEWERRRHPLVFTALPPANQSSFSTPPQCYSSSDSGAGNSSNTVNSGGSSSSGGGGGRGGFACDACGVCGGSSGCLGCDTHTPSTDYDCGGACDNARGGVTTEFYSDWLGQCCDASLGAEAVDCLGQCGGNFSQGSPAGDTHKVCCADVDCAGTCSGPSARDSCGVCYSLLDSSDTPHVPDSNKDCDGVCFGNATCQPSPAPSQPSHKPSPHPTHTFQPSLDPSPQPSASSPPTSLPSLSARPTTQDPSPTPTQDPTPLTFEPTTTPAPLPTQAPTSTFAPSSPTQDPTQACYMYSVVLSDAFGDGWKGNVLHLNGPHDHTFTLTDSTYGVSGFYKKFEACLVPGVYSPYACGGGDDSEVWWFVGGVSGSASDECEPPPQAGSFTVRPCQVFEVELSDAFGDGWNGNWLYLHPVGSFGGDDGGGGVGDDPPLKFTLVNIPTNLGMGSTFPASKEESYLACLPTNTYRPFACGGKWGSEISWSVDVVSGSAGRCLEDDDDGGGNNGDPSSPSTTFSVFLSPHPTAAPTREPTPLPSLAPTSADTGSVLVQGLVFTNRTSAPPVQAKSALKAAVERVVCSSTQSGGLLLVDDDDDTGGSSLCSISDFELLHIATTAAASQHRALSSPPSPSERRAPRKKSDDRVVQKEKKYEKEGRGLFSEAILQPDVSRSDEKKVREGGGSSEKAGSRSRLSSQQQQQQQSRTQADTPATALSPASAFASSTSSLKPSQQQGEEKEEEEREGADEDVDDDGGRDFSVATLRSRRLSPTFTWICSFAARAPLSSLSSSASNTSNSSSSSSSSRSRRLGGNGGGDDRTRFANAVAAQLASPSFAKAAASELGDRFLAVSTETLLSTASTRHPSPTPTFKPSPNPSLPPTPQPTGEPSTQTWRPSSKPTSLPVLPPTPHPTIGPTQPPAKGPSTQPTQSPTHYQGHLNPTLSQPVFATPAPTQEVVATAEFYLVVWLLVLAVGGTLTFLVYKVANECAKALTTEPVSEEERRRRRLANGEGSSGEGGGGGDEEGGDGEVGEGAVERRRAREQQAAAAAVAAARTERSVANELLAASIPVVSFKHTATAVKNKGSEEEEKVKGKDEGDGEGGDEEEGELCSICLCELEPEDECKELRCKHCFHSDCLDQWLRVNPVCPLCKTRAAAPSPTIEQTADSDNATANDNSDVALPTPPRREEANNSFLPHRPLVSSEAESFLRSSGTRSMPTNRHGSGGSRSFTSDAAHNRAEEGEAVLAAAAAAAAATSSASSIEMTMLVRDLSPTDAPAPAADVTAVGNDDDPEPRAVTSTATATATVRTATRGNGSSLDSLPPPPSSIRTTRRGSGNNSRSTSTRLSGDSHSSSGSNNSSVSNNSNGSNNSSISNSSSNASSVNSSNSSARGRALVDRAPRQTLAQRRLLRDQNASVAARTTFTTSRTSLSPSTSPGTSTNSPNGSINSPNGSSRRNGNNSSRTRSGQQSVRGSTSSRGGGRGGSRGGGGGGRGCGGGRGRGGAGGAARESSRSPAPPRHTDRFEGDTSLD